MNYQLNKQLTYPRSIYQKPNGSLATIHEMDGFFKAKGHITIQIGDVGSKATYSLSNTRNSKCSLQLTVECSQQMTFLSFLPAN